MKYFLLFLANFFLLLPVFGQTSQCGNGIIEGTEECDLGPYNNDKTNAETGVSGCSTTCTIKSGWKCAKNKAEYDSMIAKKTDNITGNSELSFNDLTYILLGGPATAEITKYNIDDYPRLSAFQASNVCRWQLTFDPIYQAKIENRCAQYILDLTKFKDLNVNHLATWTGGSVPDTFKQACKNGILDYNDKRIMQTTNYIPKCKL